MGTLRKFKRTIMSIAKICMIVSLACIFLGSWHNFYPNTVLGIGGDSVIIIIYVGVLLSFMLVYDGFKIGVARLHDVIYSGSLSLVITNFITYLELSLIARTPLSPWAIILMTVWQVAVVAICCYCTNTIYFSIYKAKDILAIFGNDKNSRAIVRKMRLIKERYSIEHGISIDHSIDEIKREIDKFQVILICDFDKSLKNEILRYCYANHKKIYVLPSANDIIISDSYKSRIFDTPVLICRNRGLTIEQKLVKRLMDIAVSGVALLILSPIMLIIAIAIKLCDGGPIFFKQNRVTINGKIFNVLKFRSMIVDADKDGAKKATNNDDRITPVGKIIRRLRVDELPQLLNILFGSMSLVGPRPERTENVHEYTTLLPEFDLRHTVKGGLTGYAQIYGKYNTSPADKLNMDLIYIENYSLFLDIKLLIMTLKILFVKESTEGFDDEEANVNVKKRS